MSTASTAPILTETPRPPVPDPGADTAPGGIVVHSCTHVGPATLLVRLTGEIDHHSAAPLRAILLSAAADGRTDLILDASRVTFCDSGLLGVLDLWSRLGRRYRIDAPPPVVLRLLRAAAGTLADRLPGGRSGGRTGGRR
ncbi:STAS domain-containing protein [Streptomyces sp. Je 1-79]|uniref:STAS domain-containing protein n=1 Tax=Streptomyces sp. Je 1-79 TaxID=2943847 RepID=UPI0021A90296|nr:STAS domain-containing protein [Streptomyces sp. Je 1-79]MCT4351568.1 STAS domain-containing protein [Streptomyces sp. Je 1-79]